MKQASVTPPLQTPGTIRRPAPAAQQHYGKTRRAGRVGEQGLGVLRPRAPARNSGAGRSRLRFASANAQQEKRDAGGFRRSRQAQGRGEIKRARGVDNLDQGGAEAFTTRRVDSRTQDSRRIPPPHQRQRRRIGAKFRQPHAVQPPGFVLQEILTRPEQRPPRRCTQGKRQTKTNGGGPIGAAGSLHLMQASPAQPAAQKGVDVRRAQSEAPGALQ